MAACVASLTPARRMEYPPPVYASLVPLTRISAATQLAVAAVVISWIRQKGYRSVRHFARQQVVQLPA